MSLANIVERGGHRRIVVAVHERDSYAFIREALSDRGSEGARSARDDHGSVAEVQIHRCSFSTRVLTITAIEA